MMGSKKDDIISLLSDLDLFAVLMDRELEIIADNCDIVRYKAGSLVFDVNNTSRELFVVQEGEILITRYGEGHGDIYLAQYGPGNSFGELDLFENSPRDATAVALRDSRLLRFPREGVEFSRVLAMHPRISARLLYNLLATISGRLRGTHRLIREKAPWIRNLKRELFTDKLTGLFNEKFLLEDFRLELPGYGAQTSLIIIKPDNFKEINDSFGHGAGDRILMLISILIQSVMREKDYAVRYRGDEFAAVLPETGTAEAVKIARELGRAISEADIRGITGNNDIRITSSMGVATYPGHSRESRQLIDIAHGKMMKARSKGGNRIVSPAKSSGI